jgi:hypothetical protein
MTQSYQLPFQLQIVEGDAVTEVYTIGVQGPPGLVGPQGPPGPSGVFVSVVSGAALSGTPDGTFVDGTIAYVSGPGSITETYFRIDRQSSATPDGLTVLSTDSGMGRWVLFAATNALVTVIGPATVSVMPGFEYFVDVTLGDVVLNVPALLFAQFFAVKASPYGGQWGANSITINATSPQVFEQAVPFSTSTPLATYVIGGPSSSSQGGASDAGLYLRWRNGGITLSSGSISVLSSF